MDLLTFQIGFGRDGAECGDAVRAMVGTGWPFSTKRVFFQKGSPPFLAVAAGIYG
jgi:hypothetical protein